MVCSEGGEKYAAIWSTNSDDAFFRPVSTTDKYAEVLSSENAISLSVTP